MSEPKQICRHCGGELESVGGLPVCLSCNDSHGEHYNLLSESIGDFAEQSDKVLIECPGATIYHADNGEVSAGVKFIDNDDPSRGYEIVGHRVYGPKHVKRRWVKKEDVHLIRRCQSCQDYTIRMRRKEGPNLYIPSRRGHRPYPRDSKVSNPG
jgi:rRNA maturation protein Nop10